MSLLREPENEDAPLSHNDTKAHKEVLIYSLNFVQLRDLVALRQAFRQAQCGTQYNTLWQKIHFAVDSALKSVTECFN